MRPRLSKRLTCRIIAPVVVLMVCVGVSLYAVVLGSVTAFYNQQTAHDMVDLSEDIFAELNAAFTEVVPGRDVVEDRQVALFDSLEKESRWRNFRILIYSSNGDVLFASKLLQNESAQDIVATLEASPNHPVYVIDGEEFHIGVTSFSPWKWHILLLKTDRYHEALSHNVQKVYWQTFCVLFVATICLVFFLTYHLKKPVQSIVRSVQLGELPHYHGVYEFEYLSHSIASMMELLQANEERHLDIFNGDHDAILIYSLEGELLEFNQTMLEMFTITATELSESSFRKDLSSAENIELFENLWGEVLKGRPQGFVWISSRYGGGDDFYTQINLKRTMWGGQEIILFNIRNIDDRVKMEAALAHSRENLLQQKKAFETLFEKSADAVLLVEKGKFVECNEAALKMYGYTSKKAILNFQPFELSPEYQPDGSLSAVKAEGMMAKVVAEGFHQFEWLHIRGGGEEFWADLVLTNLMFGQRQIIHGVVRDISSQKKLEEDLLRERDLARLANLAKSEFLANMSHELRTPMHGVLSYARMGAKRWETVSRQKLQRYFQTIESSGTSLMSLLNDLLDLSRLDAQKMVYSMGKSDIMARLRLTRQEYLSMAADKGVALEIVGGDVPVYGWFDSDKMSQVLRNIVSNGIKFSDTGRRIRLWVEGVKENGHPCLQVTIADGGIGIPQDELVRIFDTFTQSSKTCTGAGGTGLGLAICKKIIADHHGRIWAENNEGRGACFVFTVPADEASFTALASSMDG